LLRGGITAKISPMVLTLLKNLRLFQKEKKMEILVVSNYEEEGKQKSSWRAAKTILKITRERQLRNALLKLTSKTHFKDYLCKESQIYLDHTTKQFITPGTVINN
jgi:hypothetical protein